MGGHERTSKGKDSADARLRYSTSPGKNGHEKEDEERKGKRRDAPVAWVQERM